jgi:molybdate transport system substrate-binding protein
VRVVAMGDPRSVPAGAYAQQVLNALGLADAVKGKTVLGTDVRQVLADVETGSADAGLVYATDAAISTGVRVVADAPENSHMPIVYPVAVLRSSTNPDAARAFVQFLQSSAARAIFQKYGFRPAAK